MTMAIRHDPPRPRLERMSVGAKHYVSQGALSLRWRRRIRVVLLMLVSAAAGAGVTFLKLKGL